MVLYSNGHVKPLNSSFGLTGVCRLAIWGAIEGLGPLPTTKSAVFWATLQIHVGFQLYAAFFLNDLEMSWMCLSFESLMRPNLLQLCFAIWPCHGMSVLALQDRVDGGFQVLPSPDTQVISISEVRHNYFPTPKLIDFLNACRTFRLLSLGCSFQSCVAFCVLNHPVTSDIFSPH